MRSGGGRIADHHVWLILSIIGTLGLAYLSLIRAPTIRIGPDVENRLMYFLAYLIYAVVVAMWRYTSKPRAFSWRGFVLVAGGTAIYGSLLEWLQLYFPHRDPDLLDGVCNAIGAICGSFLVFAIALRGGRQ